MSPSIIEPSYRAGGRLGSARRWHQEQVPNAERHLRVALLAELIKKTVASKPSLTTEQLDKLSQLLHSERPHASKAV